MEFDWDNGNVLHIAKHDVRPEEIESLFERPTVTGDTYEVDGEVRANLYGETPQGRLLVVPHTIRNERFRPITAYEMKKKDLKFYGSQLNEEAY